MNLTVALKVMWSSGALPGSAALYYADALHKACSSRGLYAMSTCETHGAGISTKGRRTRQPARALAPCGCPQLDLWRDRGMAIFELELDGPSATSFALSATTADEMLHSRQLLDRLPGEKSDRRMIIKRLQLAWKAPYPLGREYPLLVIIKRTGVPVFAQALIHNRPLRRRDRPEACECDDCLLSNEASEDHDWPEPAAASDALAMRHASGDRIEGGELCPATTDTRSEPRAIRA